MAERVDQLRRRMLVRGDQLYTSTLTVGEILAKPVRQQRLDLVDQYLAFFRRSAINLLTFDLNAARFYARIRSDPTIRPPDAIQLACAAAVNMDLFITDKQAADSKFLRFLPVIERACTDERNFVKKAVNWALRQIGKRNQELNRAAIETAHRIHRMDSRSARWIAADALQELQSKAMRRRLIRR